MTEFWRMECGLKWYTSFSQFIVDQYFCQLKNKLPENWNLKIYTKYKPIFYLLDSTDIKLLRWIVIQSLQTLILSCPTTGWWSLLTSRGRLTTLWVYTISDMAHKILSFNPLHSLSSPIYRLAVYDQDGLESQWPKMANLHLPGSPGDFLQ